MRPIHAHRFVRVVRAALCGAGSLLSAEAAAQTGDAHHTQPPLAQSLHGAARDAYTTASRRFKEGDFPGAEAKYSEAYDLSKDPRLVFDMGICEKELHHYARMAQLLQRYEQEAGPSLSDEDRKRTDEALAAVPRYIGMVTIVVDTAGATVTVDGEPAGQAPAVSVSLDPGKHTVVVTKDGYESVERPISVSPGVASTLTIGLLASGGNGTSAGEGQTQGQGPSRAGSQELRQSVPDAKPSALQWNALAYAGVGLAGAGLVVGGVTGGLALARVGSARSQCPAMVAMVCPLGIDSDVRAAQTFGTVSTIAFVAAGVGAAAGAVGLFVWPRREQAATHARMDVAPWVGLGTAGVAGTF
jgi:hypothetical protein